MHKAFKTRCAQDGYRRGGVAHSKDWTDWKENFFTEEKLQQIVDDPKIQVLSEGVELKPENIIRTRCVRDGYRRAGVTHNKSWTVWPSEKFTEDDIALIMGDLMLTYEVVEDQPQIPKRGRPKKKPELSQDELL